MICSNRMKIFFPPINEPKPGDWLSVTKEYPQTYMKYTAQSNAIKKRFQKRPNILIVPIGTLNPSNSPNMTTLINYISNFYQSEVKVASPIEIIEVTDNYITVKTDQIDSYKIDCRRNSYFKQLQLNTTALFKILAKLIRTHPCFCMIGLTMYDLYSGESSNNFVFGEANCNTYVGIFSFSRYSNRFYNKIPDQFMDPSLVLTTEEMTQLLWRACSVSVHEIGHMFGLDHCVYFQCVMNGSNTLQESDSQPHHLCPVCLHKLYYLIGFEPVKRYKELEEFYLNNAFKIEYEWVNNTLNKIDGLCIK